MERASDAVLWERVRAGDAEAFGDLYEQHVRAVQSYCLWRTADLQIAEDTTATVFLEAWRKRRRLELTTESAAPLLLGVATNVLRQHWRGRRRYAAAVERLRNAIPPAQPGHEDEAIARLDAMRRLRDAGAGSAGRHRPLAAVTRPRPARRRVPEPGAGVHTGGGGNAMEQTPDLSALLPDEATIQARRNVLTDSVRPPGPRRPLKGGSRTRGVLAAIAALFVLGGGAALAAGVFSADDVAVEAGVSCHDRAAFNASAAIFSAAADPVAKCARVWREGAMTGGASTDVPHLVACAVEGRPVMVFPGPDEVCERLGLAPLPSDYAAPGRAHARAFRAFHLLRTRDVPAPSAVCPCAAGSG